MLFNFDSYVLHSLAKNRRLDLKNRMSCFVWKFFFSIRHMNFNTLNIWYQSHIFLIEIWWTQCWSSKKKIQCWHINAIIFKLQQPNFNTKLKFNIHTTAAQLPQTLPMNINTNIAISYDSYIIYRLVNKRHLSLENMMSYFI